MLFRRSVAVRRLFTAPSVVIQTCRSKASAVPLSQPPPAPPAAPPTNTKSLRALAPHLAGEYTAAGTNALTDDVMAFDSPEIVEWRCSTCTHVYRRSVLERVTLCGVDTRALEAATSGKGPLSVAALARLSRGGSDAASTTPSVPKVLPHETGCPHCAADFVAKARRFGSPHAIPQSVFDEMVAAGTNDPFSLAAAIVEAPKERADDTSSSKPRKKSQQGVAVAAQVRPVANPSAEFNSGFWCANARATALDDVPLSAATTRRFDFCCPQCTNTFTLRLCDRVAWARTGASKGACPHCAEASVAGLAIRLEPEWHPSKNGDLTLASLLSAKKGTTPGAGVSMLATSARKTAAAVVVPIGPAEPTVKRAAIAGVKSKSLDTPVWWICSQCAHEWSQPLRHRLRGEGCPECALAKPHH